MRSKLVMAVIASGAVIVPVGSAEAQTAAPVLDCSQGRNAVNFAALPNVITACRKPDLNRLLLLNSADTIRYIVGGRFDTGPGQVEPVGLLLDNPEEVAARLAGGSIQISPTADLDTAVASTDWNLWVDGRYSWQDEDGSISSLDGPIVSGMAGLDYKLAPNLVLGVTGAYEHSDLDGDGLFPPSQSSEGWGLGAYLGWNVTDNIVFSASVQRSSLDTDVNGLVEFDSVRWQNSESLTGYYYSGTWRMSPSLTFAWSKEWQDAALGLNAQTIETMVLSPGFQIGNTISIGGSSTVEPWIGTQLDWSIRNRTVDKVFGTIYSDPNVDLRLQGGLNFAFGGNAQLALTGEVSGLLLKHTTTYTGGANFAWQF